MTKVVIAITLFTALALGVFNFFYKDFDDCREAAFQQSDLFGQAPRRYFEITDLENYSGKMTLSFFVTFYCRPSAILSVSRFSCKLKEKKEPIEPEAESLLKLVETCK